jgi:hypothetical protein
MLLWQLPGQTLTAFGNVAVWWPITATMILLLQMSLARTIPTEKHSLAIGWLASLLFFVIGPSEMGGCDCEVALHFRIWALPLVVEVELHEATLGMAWTAFMAFVILLFMLRLRLVDAADGFNPWLLPCFAK